jgi:alkylation response protein AidB-like acyl-CoA dehydrogenase
MDGLHARLADVAQAFARDGLVRGQREALDRADFDVLADAGYLALGLPIASGGHWRGLAASVRDYARAVHAIALGDPAVALVAAMHPVVLCYWSAVDARPLAAADADAWRAQCEAVFASVHAGHWWGTLTSEPGSGGDILRTRTVAEPAPDAASAAVIAGPRWLLSGEKHFGSGSGIVSFMTTTARVPGHDDPPTLVIDVRDVPWDGSTGLQLLRAWDGHGMRATQSHAFMLARFPATCIAVPSTAAQARGVMGPLMAVLFGAVALAIVEQAMAWARTRILRTALRAAEEAEWVRAETEAFLIAQAFEGAVRAAEQGPSLAASIACLQAKLAMAELAEALLPRLSRIVGGASYSRAQPLGQWAQDVRALGFLRPPWGLAATQLADALRRQHAPPAAAPPP